MKRIGLSNRALICWLFLVVGVLHAAAKPSTDSSESVETTAKSKEEDRDQTKAHAARQPQTMIQEKQQIHRTRQQQTIGHPPSVVPSGYPPVLGASVPRSSGGMHLIKDWRSPHTFASQNLPTRRRRAAVTVGRPNLSSYQPGGLLSMSRRPKRTFQHRYRRDITADDLNNILREVDVVELLQALGRGQQQKQPHLGYPSLSYGQQAPRFAPQPALFPEYREEEQQRASPPPGTVGRMWRRSGFSSGLSRVPGFKRSSPPIDLSDYTAHANDNEIYSLAAMLGAEADPRSQRIRRVAM